LYLYKCVVRGFEIISYNIAIKRSGNPSKNLSSGMKWRAEKFLRAGLVFGLISGFHEENCRRQKKLPLNLLLGDFSHREKHELTHKASSWVKNYLWVGAEVEAPPSNRKNYRAILRILGLGERFKYYYIVTKIKW